MIYCSDASTGFTDEWLRFYFCNIFKTRDIHFFFEISNLDFMRQDSFLKKWL